MVARGYSSALLVAQEMGTDLTAAQLDQAADLIEDAESFADRITGRTWLVSSVTDEWHRLTGPEVHLNLRPVSAVSSVKLRRLAVGATDSVLAAGSGYELVDPTNGVVLLSAVSFGWSDPVINTEDWSGPYVVKVSYTAAAVVPGAIRRGVTKLVAYWMAQRTSAVGTEGIKSYSVGDELSVTYKDDDETSSDIPSEILSLFRQYRAMAFA